MKKSFIITPLLALIILGSCSQKQEKIAKTEMVMADTLRNSEVADDVLDEFEYETDSLDTAEGED